MGSVDKTAEGTFRARWRDPAGRQRSKTFKTKREANAFVAEIDLSLSRGAYVSPDAGRIRLADFAAQWLASREVQARTAERTLSVLRTHVLPEWGVWPVAKIHHMAIQEWVTGLVRRRAPGTVVRCHSTLSMILKTAVRARLIAANPVEGIKIPPSRVGAAAWSPMSRADFFGRLVPAVPPRFRALVCAAAGAGLRWGECAGLTWGAVDLQARRLRVVQVAVETAASVTLRPFPKSRAGLRTVPMPDFLHAALRTHHARLASPPASEALVFPSREGGPLRRNNFRRRVWLPSLVRSGMLGQVEQVEPGRVLARWRGRDGLDHSAVVSTMAEAIRQVAMHAAGASRFHDLRHSYATWLVTEGVPINVVRKVMGHEQTSTTLDICTHAPDDYERRVVAAFAADVPDLWLDHDPDSAAEVNDDDSEDV